LSLDVGPSWLWRHQFDHVFEVTFTLLYCKVYEIVITLLMKVRQEILMKINALQEVNLKLSHCAMLVQHPLHRNHSTVKPSLEDTRASASLTE